MGKRVILAPHVQIFLPKASFTADPRVAPPVAEFLNITDFSQGFELSEEIEQHDATTSVNQGNVGMLGGLSSFSATLNFLQDFDAGKLHEIIYPMVKARSEAYFFVRPETRAAISEDNRCIVFRGVVATYSPMTASINTILANAISISPGPTSIGFQYCKTEAEVIALDSTGFASYDEATKT